MKALTLIELEVLAHAARGKTVDETAAALSRGRGTVKHHRTAVIDKLDATNIVDAVRIAFERGLFGAQPVPRLALTAGQRRAFYAKCNALDNARQAEPLTSKREILVEAAEEFHLAAIESVNDLDQEQASWAIDRLQQRLESAGATSAAARETKATATA